MFYKRQYAQFKTMPLLNLIDLNLKRNYGFIAEKN